MKKIFLAGLLILVQLQIFSQPGKKKVQKAPAQTEMSKRMDDQMKGMTEEEKDQMRSMMKDVIPGMEKKPGSDPLSFTENRKLIPAKDVKRINTIPKKIFTDADVMVNTTLLYGKLMTKIPPAEKTIIMTVLAKTKTSAAIMAAALTSMLQGHKYAAIGLALKAVQVTPKNVVYQNNLAAILSQSGYPEKAIPYLKKLSTQYPGNSTVLHNMGYAWFMLGEVDTAQRLFSFAAARNPNNPETQLCRGLIEEMKGDPQKAADHYVESFENAPNPFTDHMAQNVHAGGRLEQIDFEKLKSRIVIYEYFKKDWIKIPKLSDHVDGYETDMKVQNGYDKMFEELDEKLDLMLTGSWAELEAVLEGSEDSASFAKTMSKEYKKGINMMSLPAVYVEKIIMAHITKWTSDYIKEYNELTEQINAKEMWMTRSEDNDKCADIDRKNNEFLAYANPLIRNFFAKKSEECRVWLNALCTWTWYVAGNPKNTVMTECLTWTKVIINLYRAAILDQHTSAKSCVNQNGDAVAFVPLPAFPNFTCPAVVSIPIGLDELRISSETINFDANIFNIRQAEGAKITNLTLSFGGGIDDISEAGKYGNPYAKTGNGSIITSGINYGEIDDAELSPLTKILDDLTALSEIIPDELAWLDPKLLDKNRKLNSGDLKNLLNANLARKLLKEMMSTKCPGELPVKKKKKDEFTVSLGELWLEPIMEVGLGDLKLWNDEVKAWVNTKTGAYEFEDGFTITPGKVEFLDVVETDGLPAVIINALDTLETITSIIRSLFD